MVVVVIVVVVVVVFWFALWWCIVPNRIVVVVVVVAVVLTLTLGLELLKLQLWPVASLFCTLAAAVAASNSPQWRYLHPS